MQTLNCRVAVVILVSICITGAIALPLGDPRLIAAAITLELLFVALTILVWRGYRKALYVCVFLSVAVMVGNSLAPPHVQIMATFSKPVNAIILITGGYLLQGALIFVSLREVIAARRQVNAGNQKAGSI